MAALGGSRASSCDAGVGAALRGAKEGNTMSLEEGGKTVEVVNRRMPDSVVYRKDSPFPWGSKYSASTGSTSPAFYLQETWSPSEGMSGPPCCVFGCLITDSRAREELRTHLDPSRAREKGATTSQWHSP